MVYLTLTYNHIFFSEFEESNYDHQRMGRTGKLILSIWHIQPI